MYFLLYNATIYLIFKIFLDGSFLCDSLFHSAPLNITYNFAIPACITQRRTVERRDRWMLRKRDHLACYWPLDHNQSRCESPHCSSGPASCQNRSYQLLLSIPYYPFLHKFPPTEAFKKSSQLHPSDYVNHLQFHFKFKFPLLSRRLS